MDFELHHQDPGSAARAGVLRTDHGKVHTPIFMPVGTLGSVKGISQEQLVAEVNAEIILANTYHLYLRPGQEVLQEAGGLHRFMGWNRPLLTDSGGYQVFSLGDRRKISEEGALFRSHIDGSPHLFTPERVIEIQRKIGADIIMAFDECCPYPATYSYARDSMERTHRWIARCFDAHRQTPALYGHSQSLFPIIQGSTYKDLREQSTDFAVEREADGHAIGGLSVGEPEDILYELTEFCCARLPQDRPRYLMGVGTPWNLLECISLGIDMFDCVMPTRNGRNGMLFTSEGIINIKNKKWEKDFSPLDDTLPGGLSSRYSKAYLRHLFVSRELLGLQIASLHNLIFYLHLVRQARARILEGNFRSWKEKTIPLLKQRR